MGRCGPVVHQCSAQLLKACLPACGLPHFTPALLSRAEEGLRQFPVAKRSQLCAPVWSASWCAWPHLAHTKCVK